MKKPAVIFLCSVILLTAVPAFAESGAKAIMEGLEEIQTQLNDLSGRQQKLLQELENLKIIARRY